ncbi:MAG: hypothetical protein D4R72_02610 [Nitrosopumilales archaeon]|nr:MAG: hypothetical protein D4R72_02610 [Nitrosopumilales archaeon]
MITISGSTQDYITDTAIVVKIISPKGNIVKFDSISLNSDRTYSTSVKAAGPLWKEAGAYQVFVQFGSKDITAQTTFQFTGSAGGQQGQAGNTMKVDGTDLSVKYSVTNGKLLGITPNVQTNSLTFSSQTTGDGVLTVTLPRILIDTRMNDQTDGKFRVLNNGKENLNFQETSETTTDRTLSIPFTGGTTEIEIIGTELVGRVSGNTPEQIQTTSGGTLQVTLSTDPLHPNSSSQTYLNINFINKQTSAVQPSIDYKITVMQGGNQVFGIPVTHTVQGTARIPFIFQNAGTYQVIVAVEGILFKTISPETATFSISVAGQSSSNSSPALPTTPIIPPSTTTSKIPSWVRHIFIYYGQGDVSEDELLGAIKFLINQGIMKLS